MGRARMRLIKRLSQLYHLPIEGRDGQGQNATSQEAESARSPAN